MKKIQRKAKQQEGDKSLDKEDSEPHIKQEPHSEGKSEWVSLGWRSSVQSPVGDKKNPAQCLKLGMSWASSG